jgi:hypothetical protein
MGMEVGSPVNGEEFRMDTLEGVATPFLMNLISGMSVQQRWLWHTLGAYLGRTGVFQQETESSTWYWYLEDWCPKIMTQQLLHLLVSHKLSLVFDSGISCLPPVSMKMWQENL